MHKGGAITSVADLDPDLFGSPGSGSGTIPDPDPLSTKKPCNYNFIQLLKFDQ